MSLMTGLVLVWGSVSKMLQNMQQYLEGEENRPSNQKEVDMMEKLTTRLEEMDMMDDDIRCAYLTELCLFDRAGLVNDGVSRAVHGGLLPKVSGAAPS